MTNKNTTLPETTAFLWLGKAYHAATAAFEGATGMTAARWRLLLLIHRQKGCSQKQLVGMIRVDPGSITRQLKALEAEGLIEREDDAADNRLTRVELSAQGEVLVRRTFEIRKTFLARMLEGIPERDMATCIRTLEKIAVNMGDEVPMP